jgi:DNA-binding response OmpR family regulator
VIGLGIRWQRRGVVSTVLVVDDRPDARDSMTRPLAAAGFDVRETATGRDALRLARLQVDAVVLDLVLPDMVGYDVLRKLKDDPATKNIPVILKTAVHLDDGHREVALDAGAAEYFAEPFDPQAIVAVVRRLIDGGGVPGPPAKP